MSGVWTLIVEWRAIRPITIETVTGATLNTALAALARTLELPGATPHGPDAQALAAFHAAVDFARVIDGHVPAIPLRDYPADTPAPPQPTPAAAPGPLFAPYRHHAPSQAVDVRQVPAAAVRIDAAALLAVRVEPEPNGAFDGVWLTEPDYLACGRGAVVLYTHPVPGRAQHAATALAVAIRHSDRWAQLARWEALGSNWPEIVRATVADALSASTAASAAPEGERSP